MKRSDPDYLKKLGETNIFALKLFKLICMHYLSVLKWYKKDINHLILYRNSDDYNKSQGQKRVEWINTNIKLVKFIQKNLFKK